MREGFRRSFSNKIRTPPAACVRAALAARGGAGYPELKTLMRHVGEYPLPPQSTATNPQASSPMHVRARVRVALGRTYVKV